MDAKAMAESADRLAPDYLDRVYLEVMALREPKTGEKVKVVAFKVLNTDGTIALRQMALIKKGKVQVRVLSENGVPGSD
ncbi:hypothetical protein E3E36_00810 [Thermococcus sp. M36]|uniref:hypothetical protein n=1 Tax=Thermococcus sp. M36 TaxID=1638261 RepID=UPI00143B3CA4|nr:hypothetical protein [Thermococcus sp. M36]NJE04713.1 hypothetical protein [Thermococcus sp. M36]